MSGKIYGYIALAAGALVITAVSATASVFTATKVSDHKELKRRAKLDKEFDLMDKKTHGDTDLGNDSTDSLSNSSLYRSVQHPPLDTRGKKTRETLSLKRGKNKKI